MLLKNYFMKNVEKKFYSEKNNKPFSKCVFCETNLKNYEHGFVVEKAFRFNKKKKKHELVFEYALCLECVQILTNEMSEETTMRIADFFEASIRDFGKDELGDAKRRTETCMITREDLSKSFEYQIAAYFIEDEMVVSDRFPFAIGGDVIDAMQDLISEKTRDFTDKFKEIILPPDEQDKVPKDRIIIF